MFVNANRKQKVCYVLPVYDADADTHFAYLYDLISRAGETLHIFLVIERAAKGIITIPHVAGIYVQRFRFFPLRALENFLVLLFLRFLGFGKIYIHYSYVSAFNAALITRICTGTSYYWNCGMPWLFGEDSFLKIILALVHVFVTGTPRMAKLYAEMYGISQKKMRVMPNWISVSGFGKIFSEEEKVNLKKKLAIPSDKKIVLFVHRLSKRKGAHILPEILTMLIRKNIAAIIVGDGPERETLESNLAEMDLSKHVRILGSIPQNTLPLFYAVADLFIMPSEEEGFPHVLLEAMVYGVPFVATDVGGVRDIVPPSFQEYIVPPDDPTDFGVRAGNLLSLAPEEHQKMKVVLQGWVKQYDISAVTERFIELFHL